MINVLLADDHTMFVDGIDSILKAESDINVVGKVYTGPEVVEFVKNNEVDLILLDVNLPGMNGIEVCKKLKEFDNKTKILAISMFNEESFVTEILNNGAEGYILKNTGREELLKALRTVVGGKSYFSDDVTQTIMKRPYETTSCLKTKRRFLP